MPAVTDCAILISLRDGCEMVKWTEAAVAALRMSVLTPCKARTLPKSSEQDLLSLYLPDRDWRVMLVGAAMIEMVD